MDAGTLSVQLYQHSGHCSMCVTYVNDNNYKSTITKCTMQLPKVELVPIEKTHTHTLHSRLGLKPGESL